MARTQLNNQKFIRFKHIWTLCYSILNYYSLLLYLMQSCKQGAHTLRAVLREAGRLAGRQAGFGKHGNTLESTHWEQEQACRMSRSSVWTPMYYCAYQILPASQLLAKLLSVHGHPNTVTNFLSFNCLKSNSSDLYCISIYFSIKIRVR